MFVPAPTPLDEAERIQALYSLQILDTPPEERFDRITRMAQRIFGVPIALISLLDQKRQWFKSCQGLNLSQTARDISFCGHAILNTEPLIIPDALLDRRFAENPFVVEEPFIRLYAGYPLVGPGGYIMGTLCIIDNKPRQLSETDLETLRDLAKWAETELNLILHKEEALVREQAEAELRESENRYRVLITAMEEGIVLQDQDAVIHACNASAERILGLTFDQMQGRSSIDPRWRAIHEDGSAFPGETHPSIKTLQTGQPYSNVIMGVHKPDGTLTWISINTRPIFKEANSAKPEVVVCTFSEITKRKQAEEALRASEERFRQLAENIESVFWITNPKQSEMLYVSKAYEKIWGRSCQSLYDNPKSFLEAIHPEDRRRVITSQKKKLLIGKNKFSVNYDEEYRVINPDGTIRWVWERAFPVRNAKGEIYRIAEISEDITERKKVDRLKNEFVSTVSHELRTPLTSIQGALGLVMGGVTGEVSSNAKVMLDIAYKNCGRLVRLINDILDIEKIESGRMVFNFKPVLLTELVQAALEANQSYGQQFKVSFQLQPFESEESAWVLADSDRLAQVLSNLLSNAAKFSPPGGTVTISIQRHFKWLQVAVSDKGSGIPAEFHSRIFQKFAQADSSDTRQKGGTGLGLSINTIQISEEVPSVAYFQV